MARRVKISAVDTAWLRMDRPQNLMMICGVLLFRDKLSLARLRKVIGERFVVFKRFRQRPVQMTGVAFWENDPHFDIAHHVLRMALPGRAGPGELREFVSGLATTPLDPARPMWQFHLVDYEGGSALVARIHHCYADGIALVRVMLSMMDAGANGPPAMPFAPQPHKRDDDDDGLGQLLAPLAGVLGTARKIGATLLEKGVVGDPGGAFMLKVVDGVEDAGSFQLGLHATALGITETFSVEALGTLASVSNTFFQADVPVVPEPDTLLLFALGLLGLGWFARHRKIG